MAIWFPRFVGIIMVVVVSVLSNLQSSVGIRFVGIIMVVVVSVLSNLQSSVGIRFVIDREECFSHLVENEGDIIHVSFVVIKADAPWNYGNDGVDLVVKGGGANGTGDEQIMYSCVDKTNDKFEFAAKHKGEHQLCFKNKALYHETIDFDIHVRHINSSDQHAKDEHLNPLLEQIAKLEEALYDIQFEQHWLEAQTDRQALVNEGMSRRAMHKAMFESASLVGASILQVYLLRCLFERKLDTSRV